jgi:ABC-2 type transport system permease protein
MIWWSISIIVLVAITVLTYGAVADQNAAASAAFDSLGDDIGSFVGTSDLFSPVGYLNSQLYYITLPVLFIILSTVLASGLFGKEENNRTIELLLARPLSRTQLLGGKAFAGLLIIAIIGTIATLSIVLCARSADLPISTGNLILATATAVCFSTAFGAIAFMLLAASTRTRRFATLAAIVFSFGGYIIASLGGMVDWLGTLAKLFPYHYYDPNALLTGSLPGGLQAYVIGIYVVAAVVAIVGFRRRDIA